MKCQHQKVYAPLCSFFRYHKGRMLEMRPWICAKCLEEGEEEKDFQREYYDLKQKKSS